MSQHGKRSLAESLASESDQYLRELTEDLTESQCRELLYSWRGFWARPSQILPGTPGAGDPRSDWLIWLINAGRGFGKTRTGAETVRQWAEQPSERILMIAPTGADVRDTMIEGPSGLLQCYPPDGRPVYEPSKRRIIFPSGAAGILRSADEPERLRGPQFTKFWADELCAWRFQKRQIARCARYVICQPI